MQRKDSRGSVKANRTKCTNTPLETSPKGELAAVSEALRQGISPVPFPSIFAAKPTCVSKDLCHASLCNYLSRSCILLFGNSLQMLPARFYVRLESSV